ncbi:MAG: hypothetical protein GXO48_07325 [Chlorobi bacterium]|nr:hypothetical protein [Chlorobiota bacterium]
MWRKSLKLLLSVGVLPISLLFAKGDCGISGQELRTLFKEAGVQLPYATWIVAIPDPLALFTYRSQARAFVYEFLQSPRVHEKVVFVVGNNLPVPYDKRERWLRDLLGRFYSPIRLFIDTVVWDYGGDIVRRLTHGIDGMVWAYLIYDNKVIYCNEIKWHRLGGFMRSLGSQLMTINYADSVSIPCNDSVSKFCMFDYPVLKWRSKLLFVGQKPTCLAWFDVEEGFWDTTVCFDERDVVRLFCKFFASSPEECYLVSSNFQYMSLIGRPALFMTSFTMDSSYNIWAGGDFQIVIPQKTGRKTTTDVKGYKAEDTYVSVSATVIYQMDTNFNIIRIIPVTADYDIQDNIFAGEPMVDPASALEILDTVLVTYWFQNMWLYSTISLRPLLGKLKKVYKFCGFPVSQDTFSTCINLGGRLKSKLSKQLRSVFFYPMMTRFNNTVIFTSGVGENLYDVRTGKVVATLSKPFHLPQVKERLSSFLSDTLACTQFAIRSISSDGKNLYVWFQYGVCNSTRPQLNHFIEVFDTNYNSIGLIPLDAYPSLRKCIVSYGGNWVGEPLEGNQIIMGCYDDKLNRYVLKIWEIGKQEVKKVEVKFGK